VPRNNYVGALESATRGSQAPKQRHRNRKRWIRHDSKGTSRKSNVAAVGTYDDDVGVGEFASKFLSTSWVELEGNNAGASLEERSG
jgi:hypothetical protein